MLNALGWPAGAFMVTCLEIGAAGHPVLGFPSPAPRGCAINDQVVLDWHVARGPDGRPAEGPALLALDILDGHNRVAGYVANWCARRGVHAFVMHMPEFVRRRRRGHHPAPATFFARLRQAIADARRARDAIAALPGITGGRVALQGTSLGGFIASVAGALDGAFDRVFITLAGGDAYRVLTEGRRDAALLRHRLAQAGMAGERLRQEAWSVEPLRLAHRLDPRRTWLQSARYDRVVPAAATRALVEAIGLPPTHHRIIPAGHYTAALWSRALLGDMVRELLRGTGRAEAPRCTLTAPAAPRPAAPRPAAPSGLPPPLRSGYAGYPSRSCS